MQVEPTSVWQRLYLYLGCAARSISNGCGSGASSWGIYLGRPAPMFSFSGFLGPVNEPPVVNVVQVGRGVLIEFSLGGDYGISVIADGTEFTANFMFR